MFPNMNGVNYWDAGVGLPDISVLMGRLASPSPTVIWSATEYYPNVTSTGSNFFDFVPATPIQITQVTIPHVVELIDYDGADTLPSPDDSMGVIAFYPYVSANGFPTIIIVNDNSIPLRFELTVSYQW